MKWRRFAAVLLFAFLAFVVVHSLLPERWVGSETDAATGATIASPAYACGTLWGGRHVTGPRRTQFPLTAAPCSDRTTLQVLSFADVLVGVGGLYVVFLWYRKARRDHEAELAADLDGAAVAA